MESKTVSYERVLKVFSEAIRMKIINGFDASSIVAGLFDIPKEQALDELIGIKNNHKG